MQLGIITKDDGKRNVSLMVRMPSNIAFVIDHCVGVSHSSRPDFVIDGIRQFMVAISYEEARVFEFIETKKDASREVKLQFYYESMKSFTLTFRNTIASAAEKSEKKDVDILLSLPKGLAAQIDEFVNRTKAFKNHQEFIKCATIFLSTTMGAVNTNSMLAGTYLINNEATKELQEQVEKMRKEMEGK